MDNGFEQMLQEERQRANKHMRKGLPLGITETQVRETPTPTALSAGDSGTVCSGTAALGKGLEAPTKLSMHLPSGQQEAHVHRKTKKVHSSFLDSHQGDQLGVRQQEQPRRVTHAQWTIVAQLVPELSGAA